MRYFCKTISVALFLSFLTASLAAAVNKQSPPFTSTNDFILSTREFLCYRHTTADAEDRDCIAQLLSAYDSGMTGIAVSGESDVVFFDETGTNEYRTQSREMVVSVLATFDLINRQMPGKLKHGITKKGRIIFRNDFIRFYMVTVKDPQTGQLQTEKLSDAGLEPNLLLFNQ